MKTLWTNEQYDQWLEWLDNCLQDMNINYLK